MDSTDIFGQLSILIVLVTVIAFTMKQLRQPLILGYILTGILISVLSHFVPNNLLHINDSSFEVFSKLGIALLLFIIGLDLKISVFRKLGGVVFGVAAATLVSLGGLGIIVTQAFGFSFIEGLIAGLALFFSSTIIIVKFLSDKKENTRLHGQIAIGVILVEDLVATVALLLVAAGKDGFNPIHLGQLFIVGTVLLLLLFFLIKTKLVPQVWRLFASSQELLFLATIAWGLGIASIAKAAGFSIEVGALLAGIALTPLPYTQEMVSRLKPLRDFFIVIFFITLGAQLNTSSLANALLPALVLSVIVIIVKPLVVMNVMHLFGYTRRTSFKTGINLSQISEFSIILIAIAGGVGLIGNDLTAIITLVALITITVSSYLMQFDNRLLARLERRFTFFQDDHEEENDKEAIEHHKLILIGYRRGGHEFVKTFKQMKKKYVVIDYDPIVIESLERLQLPHMYGDATDVEFLREVGIKHAQLVVSTMNDFSTNEHLLDYTHRVNPNTVVVCHAHDHDEAAALYRAGAAYVILAHYIGNEQINSFIRRNGTARKAFNKYRQKHLLGLGRAALND